MMPPEELRRRPTAAAGFRLIMVLTCWFRRPTEPLECFLTVVARGLTGHNFEVEADTQAKQPDGESRI